MAMNRRSFLGSIAALVAFPRSLFTRQPPITLGRLRDETYSYKITYVTDAGETIAESATVIDRTFTEPAISRRLYARAPGQAEHTLIGYASADEGPWTLLEGSEGVALRRP